MRNFLTFFAAASAFVLSLGPIEAVAGVSCQGWILERSVGHPKFYTLEPMTADATMLVARTGDFSFVADIEEEKKGLVRLFIHDLNADRTAVSDTSFRRFGKELYASMKYIVGYNSLDTKTLEISCVQE